MMELDYASSDDEVKLAEDKLPCEMCNKNSRFYKCPKCAMFTCSLECCREHKTKMDCTGIRDRTEFVSNRNFKESHLKSDYHFLEDVLQTKDRAKRTLAQNCGGEKRAPVNKRNKNTKKEEAPQILDETFQRLESYSKSVKSLFHAARERGTKLILMPNGMTKRTLNKSLYNTKENTIYWKVFVVFITSSNYSRDALFRVDLESTKAAQQLSFAQESLIGISVDGVSENKTMDEIFEQFMQPTVENASHRHALRSLRLNKAAIRCLMLRIPSPNNNPVFLEAAMDSTLKDTLSGQTLIEYPTLYFGSYEHTSSLQTLIVDPERKVDCAGRKTGISAMAGAENKALEEESEDEEMEICMDISNTTGRKTVSFIEEVHSGGASSAKAKSVISKELLNIVPPEDAVPHNSGAVTNKINSSNVADLVNNMKQFIDATLSKDSPTEAEEHEDADGHDSGIPTPTLRALGALGGLGLSAYQPRIASTAVEEVVMEEGEVEGDAEAEGEEENEEFLAMLKELADKDIDTLRAIIAAEEEEGESDESDESDDDA